jgi:hypothetical protein
VIHVGFIQFGEFLVLKSQNRPLQDLVEIDWKERDKDRTLRPVSTHYCTGMFPKA